MYNNQKVTAQYRQTGFIEQLNDDSLTIRYGEKEVRRVTGSSLKTLDIRPYRGLKNG